MYPDPEIEISWSHLERVLGSLEEPALLLGGWAVYLLVRDGYLDMTGRDYLGSRDIDLGFSMPAEDLERSPFAHAIRLLIDEMGFKPLSFRLMREFDSEKGEPLEPEASQRLPMYQIVQMYIDLIVDRVPEGFMDAFGFIPPDEPLLSEVFREEARRVTVRAFGRDLWVPAPSVLLRMKVRSFPNRTRDHKRIKDLADMVALLLFTNLGEPEMGPGELGAFRRSLEVEEMRLAADALGLELALVETAVLSLGSH